MMDSAEIRERIAVGRAYMSRMDVTPEFRAAAAKRVENLEKLLREQEAKEQRIFDKPDERALKSIETIRELLLKKQAESKKRRV